MHSPFVFDFILNVLNNKKKYTAPTEVEQIRKSLLQNNLVITVEDFGAGSRTSKTNERKIRAIAQSALKPKKFGQLFYRLVKHYQPKTILELGTSFGITTSYMALANPEANVITVEGSKSIAAIAANNFKQLQLGNIKQVVANFDDVLPTVLSQHSPILMAYVDGNHLYSPTINYFHQILNHTTTDSILIFDDIHWSEEMEKAWKYIQQHEAVRTTIDLFFIGIVLLREDFKEKQHFSIRF
jgi:predicted O-methyltransferase YrrM